LSSERPEIVDVEKRLARAKRVRVMLNRRVRVVEEQVKRVKAVAVFRIGVGRKLDNEERCSCPSAVFTGVR